MKLDEDQLNDLCLRSTWNYQKLAKVVNKGFKDFQREFQKHKERQNEIMNKMLQRKQERKMVSDLKKEAKLDQKIIPYVDTEPKIITLDSVRSYATPLNAPQRNIDQSSGNNYFSKIFWYF